VQFECPHCQTLTDQTRENRERARIVCAHCHKPFSTQWARSEEDRALPRGAVVSERFELGRNFSNKLWNAARFALMNLADYSPGRVTVDELKVEDRWVLSRLTTVTQETTDALERYHFSTAARALYDFAWDEFCSFYVEMVKGRLQDPTDGPVARRVLAFVLDNLLRLLHPMMPFLTEEVWQLLGGLAPQRGLAEVEPAAATIMLAPWPRPDQAYLDGAIESQFADFQKALAAVREIRSRQNIPPKKAIQFSIRCDAGLAAQLAPMAPYFERMASAAATGLGPQVTPPQTHAKAALPSADIYVDLAGLIDPDAERKKLRKEEERLVKHIEAKEKKLSSGNFVERAPAEVVQRERESLVDSQRQLESVRTALHNLGGA
jgi:valyl-tRNA synthetase